jgi:predicted small secreted protein
MRRLLRNGRIIRRQAILFIVPIILLLAFMLAACGTNSGSGTSTGASGSTPVTAPTTIKSTATGCPSNEVVNSAPANPNVTIRLTNSNGTVVAHNGDLIEVRLPFGQQWSMPSAPGNVLQLQTPAGYAVNADKVCVWHFIAKNTGTAEVSFSAKAICKPGQMCPLYIMRVPFTIDVK